MSPDPQAQSPTARPETAKDAPISFGLLTLFRTFGGYGAELLLDMGLHPGQELILMQLFDRDGLTQTELQHALGSDHSTISRTVKRMEESGLITRTASSEDRRAKVVTLTPGGAALRGPLIEMWAELERLAVSSIPASRIAEFTRTTGKLERTYAVARQRGWRG